MALSNKGATRIATKGLTLPPQRPEWRGSDYPTPQATSTVDAAVTRPATVPTIGPARSTPAASTRGTRPIEHTAHWRGADPEVDPRYRCGLHLRSGAPASTYR